MRDPGVMPWYEMSRGWLILRVERVNEPGGHVHERIVDATLQGPPIVVITEREIDALPNFAKTEQGMVQIGQYVFRKTRAYDFSRGGWIWVVAGQGEFYWLRWRLCNALSGVMRKIGITIAVWREIL